MLNYLFNLKVGWILSRHMPVVPRRFDIDYPAELQKIRGVVLSSTLGRVFGCVLSM